VAAVTGICCTAHSRIIFYTSLPFSSFTHPKQQQLLHLAKHWLLFGKITFASFRMLQKNEKERHDRGAIHTPIFLSEIFEYTN